MVMLSATGQDIVVSDERFEIGRNFGTKIWNAARFMLMHTGEALPAFDDASFDAAALRADDRQILAKLAVGNLLFGGHPRPDHILLEEQDRDKGPDNVDQ